MSAPDNRGLADAGEAADRRPLFYALGGVLLAIAALAGVGPGSTQVLIALALAVGAPLVAMRLGGNAGRLVCLVAAAGTWSTLDPGRAFGAWVLIGLLLRELAYFSVPPLLVHLLINERVRNTLGIGELHVYSPMAVVWLGVVVQVLRNGADRAGEDVQRVGQIYGMCYLALLAVVFIARLYSASTAPPAPPPVARAAALEEEGRFGLAARAYQRESQFEKGAELAQRAGDWARAADMYRRSGDSFNAAEMYYRAKMWTEALEQYDLARAWPAAARLSAQIGLLDRAVAYYEKAGDLTAGIRALEAAGQKPSAEQYLRARLFAPAAQSLEARGDWVRAAEVFEQDLNDLENALRLHLQAGSWLRAGQLLETLGRPDEALQAYLALPAGILDAARVCSAMGRPEQAAELLARLAPGAIDALEDEQTLVMAAGVLSGSGRHDEAIRILQSVKRRFPASGAAFLLLGRCFLAKQMPDLAEEELRIAMGLALPPEQELESAYLLGCVLETARKDSEAIQVFYGVLQKDFGYADVEQRYRRLKESQPSA